MVEGSFLTRPLTADDEAFLAKIAENPLDQLARDVYSDYLEENGDQEEADRQRQWSAARREVETHGGLAGLDSEEMIRAAKDYVDSGEYLCEGERWDGFYLDDEFWPQFEIFTGIKVVEGKRGSFFSCSC